MNKKGQALVEFVLVLPILIFLLLGVVDISRLMIMKNHLESVLGSVDVDTTNILDKEYDIELIRKDQGSSVVVELKSCLEVSTPGLNKIIGDPACVSTSKVFEKE